MFLLREVPDQMVAFAVASRQHVEQERLDIVIQSLVVEEQLRQQTQVLAVDFVCVAVHLEDGDFSAAVDLCAGRVAPRALVEVPIEDELAFRVLQAELAEKELR